MPAEPVLAQQAFMYSNDEACKRHMWCRWQEEIAVGDALRVLQHQYGITREQMFVITKAGYPSGAN